MNNMNQVDDNKGSEISMTKLILLAEHYAVVCAPIARFYKFEAEAIKSRQCIPSKQVSHQMCQYCCSIWRPFNCTISQRRQKQKNRTAKLLKKSQRGRRLNDVEVKILSSIKDVKSRVVVRCHTCKRKSVLPMKSNQFQNSIPFKHSTRKKLTQVVGDVVCDDLKLSKKSLLSSRSTGTAAVQGSSTFSSKRPVSNDSITKKVKHQPNSFTPQSGKQQFKTNSSTSSTDKPQYKPNAFTPFTGNNEKLKLNSLTKSASKLKPNSTTTTPTTTKIQSKKHKHLKDMLSRAAAERKTASPSNLKSFIDFCRS